jgi:hypothetical protein
LALFELEEVVGLVVQGDLVLEMQGVLVAAHFVRKFAAEFEVDEEIAQLVLLEARLPLGDLLLQETSSLLVLIAFLSSVAV